MKHLIRQLTLPSFLFIAWLLLNTPLTTGNTIFGLILALTLSYLARWLRPLCAYPKRPLVALRLIWHVAIDIAKSNYQVGKLIWLGKHSNATPGFLKIPLRVKDPHALSALACIITYTPGTVWADYSEENNILTLHVLDLKDETAWRQIIQYRYESPLLEIFE